MHAKTSCFGLAVSVLAFVGCSSSDNESVRQEGAEISEADAKQKAVSYVPGTAGAVEKIETTDEHRWGVTVTLSGGQDVVVELERSGGLLDEIKSEKAPFEYELPVAGPGITPYSKARSTALTTKTGQIEAWELNMGQNKWEFYVRESPDALWEIVADAQTGEIKSTAKKASRD
jgi:uncharacterized membrane protein YkoI